MYRLSNAGLKLFRKASKCKFTPKDVAAQLPSILTFTNAYLTM